MVKFLLLAASLSLSAIPLSAVALDNTHADYPPISQFIEAADSGNKTAIAKLIAYPLKRLYPLPAIQNEDEMVLKFAEVFDKQLLTTIGDSNIDTDWEEVGWRGVMMHHGMLWIRDGKVIAINYRNPLAQQLWHQLVEEQKSQLHPTLQNFQTPILEWQTPNYRVRVDQLESQNYRYAAWQKDAPLDAPPDIILVDGVREADGSGGNHYYDFTNGNYLYRLSVGEFGGSYGILEVYKNDELILTEDREEETTQPTTMNKEKSDD